MEVKTFNREKIKKLISECDPYLRMYIQKLQDALTRQETITAEAIQKLKEAINNLTDSSMDDPEYVYLPNVFEIIDQFTDQSEENHSMSRGYYKAKSIRLNKEITQLKVDNKKLLEELKQYISKAIVRIEHV